MSNKSDNICFGDVVSLYYEDDGIHGYYYLNGLVDQRGGTIEIQKKNGFPPNFQRFLFKIQYANHYVAWKKFQKELEARGRKNFDFRKLIEDSNQTLTEEEKLSNKILTELQLKCEEEEKNNIKESGRSTGKQILYGQPFQLVHIETNSYVTVDRESAELHKDCLKISLTKGSSTIFSIIPCYKYKIEGEAVRYDDHVKIWAKKLNLYLNVGKGKKHFDGRNEVNMSSVTNIKWKLKRFSSGEYKQDIFKCGDLVRIQHKQNDGYLVLNDNEKVVLCPATQLENFSTHSIWEVEMDDPSRGGMLNFEGRYKLRHVSTGKYLCTESSNKENEEEMLEEEDVGEIEIETEKKEEIQEEKIPVEKPEWLIDVTESNNNDVWSLKSSNFTKENFVNMDAYFSLYQVDTQLYLHLLQHKQQKSEKQSALSGRKEFNEEDVFTFKRLDPEESYDLLFIQNSIFPIETIVKDLTEMDQKEAQLLLKNTSYLNYVIGAFGHLIKYCTSSDQKEDDLLKREGLPYPKRQRALREKKIIDLAMACVSIPFDQKYITKEELLDQKQNFKAYFKLVRYVYKFIYLVTKENSKNKEYMLKFFAKIQSQVEWSYHNAQVIADAMSGVIKDNRKLIETITSDQIIYFINCLENSKIPQIFIDLLSSLCDVQGESVSKNQDIISKTIFEGKTPETLMGNVLIPVNENSQLVVYFKGQKIFLKDLIMTNDYVILLQANIKLVAQLCFGRNEYSQTIIKKATKLEINNTIYFINNEQIPPEIKSNLIRFLLNCHINTNIFGNKPLFTLTRKSWIKYDPKYKDRTDNSLFESKKPPKTTFKASKEMVVKFLSGIQTLDLSKKGMNEFLYSLVIMAKQLFQNGAYTFRCNLKNDEFIGLLQLFYNLLIGEKDRKDGYILTTEERFAKSEGSIIISKIRVEILAIFDLCLEIMKENRVSKIMSIYKATESNQQKVEDASEDSNDEEEQNDYNKNGDTEKLVSDVLETTDLSNIIKGEKSLNDVLLDLSKYQIDELSVSALQFLFKLNSQNSELKDVFGKLELLVSYSMGEVYDKITGAIPKINKLLTSRIDEKIVTSTKDTVNSLIKEILKNGAVGQRLLRNSNIPFMLMEALKLKIPKDLQKLIYEFTIVFVKKNEENQIVMYKRYFNFLIKRIGQDGIVVETLIEIVSNNTKILSLIEEMHIQQIIDSIAEKGYASDYLRLLRVIISNNETARRNREMVTNNLLERKKDVIVMFEDDEGLKERNELIEKNDHINNPNSKLRYHIELLELLALCAQGQILSVEIKLQYITNFDEIVLHILDKSTIPEILHPLMKYFDEVYIYVDKDKKAEKSNIHTPNFWKLLNKISSDLEKFVRKDPGISPSYILNTILPLLSHYFEIKFPEVSSILNYEQINIFENLLMRLILILDKIAFPIHKKKIMDILKIVLDSKIPKLKERIEVTYSNKKDFKVVIIREKPPAFEKEDKIIESFLNFIKTVEPTFKKGDELNLLAKKFEKELNHFDQLIYLLSKIGKLPPNSERNQVLLKGIQILDTILTSTDDNPKTDDELLETRNMLASKRVPELLIDLISSKDNEIVENALDVAIKQFDQGNKASQKAILNYFKKENDGVFLQAIRSRIKQSMVEIKLRKDFYKKLERQKDKAQTEKFQETGFIRKILKLLQLFCEGHNLDLQNYIRFQENSFQNTNILVDILDYLFALKKYINYSNISITIQTFNFITESIQGPCIPNQLFFNNIQLYFMINEILQNDFKEKSLLRSPHAVVLKKSIMILLNSIVGESVNEEVLELMNSSIDFKLMINNIEKIIERRNNKEKHIQELHEEIVNPLLYKIDEDRRNDYVEKVRETILENEEELAYQYLFFLHTFNDNGLGNGISELKESGKFKEFEENIGRIEVLRENKIETVYFKIPELCKNLSETTKIDFMENSCDGSTPQEKVRKVLGKSNKFQKEMEHSEDRKTNHILKEISPLTKHKLFEMLIIYFGLFIAFIINLLIFLTYCQVFKVTTYSEIPIPGFSSASSFQRTTAFADMYSENIFVVLALIHLVISIGYLIAHILFGSTLGVKLSYPDDYDYPTFESPFKKKLEHYIRWGFYFLKDIHLWFYIFYIIIVVLSLIVSPLFYCLLLFELIYRSKTLQYVLKSVYLRWDVLLLTALLLMATIWCFTSIYFNLFSQQFYIQDSASGNTEYVCDTLFRCYLAIIGYGLRAEGFWEDIFNSVTDFWRLFVDLLFWIIIVLVLMNIVFGTILESFAQLRETAEDTELEMTDRCFICDIRKNRFDVKANEGINFDDHVNREHSVWNYVYFFVHLTKKEKTEYTGMEQYIYDLVTERDITFFPIQRSRMLEKSENKKEV